jgi:TIR domain/Trypsin-like peptidase domain
MGLELERVAVVSIQFATDSFGLGSGYRVDDACVLTARHVLHGRALDQVARGQVSVRLLTEGATYLPATVLWESDEHTDLAIVRIDPPLADLPGRPLTRFGRLQVDETDEGRGYDCQIVGFPQGAMDGERLDSLALQGELLPYGGRRMNRLQINLRTVISDDSLRQLSGSAVFVGDLLVGVVQAFIPGLSAVWAQPASKLFIDGHFCVAFACGQPELEVLSREHAGQRAPATTADGSQDRRPADQPSLPLKLFYSYAHEDEAMRQKLETHLKLLQRRGLIASWSDRQIGAGQEWREAIDAQLESADIILLLISSNFLASDYCYDVELARAMARHEAGEARVVPIILRPVDWRAAPFAKLQALPTDAKPITDWHPRDKGWADVALGLDRAIRAWTAPARGS